VRLVIVLVVSRTTEFAKIRDLFHKHKIIFNYILFSITSGSILQNQKCVREFVVFKSIFWCLEEKILGRTRSKKNNHEMGENFFQNTYLILQTCIGNLTVVLEIVEFGTTHAQKETTYRTHRKHGRAEGLLADTREKER